MIENCGNCRFFKESGACGRRAPVIVQYDFQHDYNMPPERMSRTEYPSTQPLNWCGEWEAEP